MTSISPSYPGLDPNAIVGRLTTITKDEDLEALRSAAANPEGHAIPENVWGQIVVGGEVVAEIYRNGAFTYTGAGHLDIDTSQPLKDIASDLKRAIGGYFQPGPAFGSENADKLKPFSNASQQFQSRLGEAMQRSAARTMGETFL